MKIALLEPYLGQSQASMSHAQNQVQLFWDFKLSRTFYITKFIHDTNQLFFVSGRIMGDCKVYVGRLDSRASESDVFDFFEKYGRVQSGMFL